MSDARLEALLAEIFPLRDGAADVAIRVRRPGGACDELFVEASTRRLGRGARSKVGLVLEGYAPDLVAVLEGRITLEAARLSGRLKLSGGETMLDGLERAIEARDGAERRSDSGSS